MEDKKTVENKLILVADQAYHDKGLGHWRDQMLIELNWFKPTPTGLYVRIPETVGLGSESQASSSVLETAWRDEPLTEQQNIAEIQEMLPAANIDEFVCLPRLLSCLLCRSFSHGMSWHVLRPALHVGHFRFELIDVGSWKHVLKLIDYLLRS